MIESAIRELEEAWAADAPEQAHRRLQRAVLKSEGGGAAGAALRLAITVACLNEEGEDLHRPLAEVVAALKLEPAALNLVGRYVVLDGAAAM